MKIVCLCCGHKLDLDETYDDYEGPVRCFPCKAMLEIKIEQGKLKSIKIAGMSGLPAIEEHLLEKNETWGANNIR